MTGSASFENRLLSVAEREMVAQTRPSGVGKLSKDDLQALARRLRDARDRAKRMAHQQRREISGKAAPRGASAARDNLGTEAKAQVLANALQRVSLALRKLTAPTQAELIRKAVARKQAAATPQRFSGGQGGAEKARPLNRRLSQSADGGWATLRGRFTYEVGPTSEDRAL